MLRGILIGAAAGVIAALLAEVLGKRLSWSEGKRRMAWLIGFGVLFALGKNLQETVLKPSPHAQAEKLFESDELYRLLAEADPSFKPEAISFFEGLAARGGTSEEGYAEGVEWGRKKMSPYLRKYIAGASDSTAVAFGSALTDALKDLQAKDAESCVGFMFGSGGTPLKATPSSELEAHMERATIQVLREGLHSPQAPVDSATGSAAVEEVVTRLVQSRGQGFAEDLVLASNADAARAQPQRACAAAVAIYSTVLQLPPAQAGEAMRYLLSFKGAQQGPAE